MNYHKKKLQPTLLCIFILLITGKSLLAQCHIDDWTALKALYESTNGENWTDNTGWEILKEGKPPINCNLNNLFGVELDEKNRIENIILDNNQLAGTLPEEIGSLLTNLKRLSLHANQINGSIPATFGNLTELIKLILSKNLLSGKIPSQLGKLTNLKFLGLGFNDFNSEIPPQLGNLNSLKQLAISNNEGLIGKIPAELGNLSQLKTLSFGACNLTGNIPPQLGQLDSLKQLILSNNQLTGSIPSELGNLNSLTELKLSWNKLTGDIPNKLSQLNNITIIKIAGNQLSGTIPVGFGNLNLLTELSLAYNELKNNIPSELGNLNNLTTLKLEWNELTGSIPTQLAGLSNLTCLDVRHNKLGGCYANELLPLCAQLYPSLNNNISDGNYFTTTWQNFCSTTDGCGKPNQNLQVLSLPTNYSGNVTATVLKNQNCTYTLKNNYVEVIDYSFCSEINNSSCPAVKGVNNKAANEVLWATEIAANILSTEYQISLAPVVSFINGNYKNELNGSVYKPKINKIIYGLGDGIERKSMSAPDIVGHEYMHYVINHMNKLSPYGESGALHESFADIFGEILEYYSYGCNDWIFGRQVTLNASGIRSLKNPKDANMAYQQPDTYKGKYWIEINDVCFHQDYCGVHTNSGVQNYWFYLLANGGSGTNDNDAEYKVEGIGIKKATNIALNSLLVDLKPNATYKDVVFSSIKTAKTLYGESSKEVEETINAWFAVGLYDINPIIWKAVNFHQTNSPMVNPNDGLYRVPVQFDLAIDSLGEDISADGLSFTFHKPETYEGLEIQASSPLTNNEVAIEEEGSTVKVEINRQATNVTLQTIPSNRPAFRVTACIVVIDIGGEETALETPYISGGTQVLPNYFVPHATFPLVLGNVENDAEAVNPLNLSVGLTNQSCGSLASIRVELGNYNSSAIPSYNYYLYDAVGTLIDSNLSTPRSFYQFYGLQQGSYKIYVEDNNASISESQKINIDFVADSNGSTCCPDHLIIPPGTIEGNFNAQETISVGIGVEITEELNLIICDE